ncbi:disease resistance protein RPV1-like [Prosopis cineraria]|uniref:disease resistance protein RPV1-like n=1 Tax=Prosopis cineraria TaxID=364024 RepID=UPI00240F8778|nr:disease resistance protein RPV1-like [Prosopis cineraria]XP_054783918.1 disease resistance protein RPV1-like [Prosopis cineraria]XP_054783919.1 disease resistance protein RPV1-like [Prosopis cineraria]XP_054783920.1 disease resistance protein RPV1-like [Prosopis cineraria]
MASSSSSAPSSRPAKEYGVFISFRGEDTRLNFTSHLHSALCRDKITTFIDNGIEKGDEVWPSLEKAIEDSTLFLVVFSEKYASSTWCLKELTKILECSKNQGHNSVMPVFYRVDPANVRKQSGSYEKAFEEHDHKGISKQQLQKWREALTYASNLGGWHCSLDRNEADLIKEIVQCVIQKMGCMYESEDHLKGLIGIHKRMEALESLLNKGSQDDVRFVGIWGMGGIGKTTLAKAMFTKLRFLAFEGSCFLSNVREESKKLGKEGLKERLVRTLLRDKGDEIAPSTMQRLSWKKVLIVLDDVDDHEQLESLAGRHNWFGSGSKILITTRDKQALGKEVDDIYELKALNFDEAFNLLSMNAFRKNCADPIIRKLATKVTLYANGIPLALKVLGSFLFDKSKEEWESQLKKLKKSPFSKIHDILKLSFEGLDREEKDIFLYLACFFKDYDVKNVRNLLDSCNYSTTIALSRLKDKALLDISFGKIDMHDLLQEMGQEIVREESKDPQNRSRLWNSDEISEILSQTKGSEAIEALSFNVSEITEEMYLSPQAFSRMPNLKFLDFYGYFGQMIKLNTPYDIEFPNQIRLLRWFECPLNSLPRTFTAENLVKIEMPCSKLTKLWDGVQNLANLREMDLQCSRNLIELPDCSRCKCLADVNLDGCSELRSVHPSILTLDSLHRLSLEYCESLTSLRSSTHLKSLGYLSLLDCSGLENFSVTSDNCDFELNLYGTAVSDELTSSSGHLSKVRKLELHLSFSSLPYNLLDLSNLRELDIGGCNKLAPILHSIFDRLRSLEVINLSCCSELFGLPDNISLLSSLRELHLCATTVETLPGGIKHLLRLQLLNVSSCASLLFIPELPPSVRRLCACDSKSLETVHLTSTIEDQVVEEDKKVSRYLDFLGCMKLNRESVKAIEAKVLLELNIATPIPRGALIRYPEAELCKVPECFMYRTNQSSISVGLSSIPQPWDGSFIFCAIVFGFFHNLREIEACCYNDGPCVGGGRASFDCGYLYAKRSKHVFFWRGQVERRIEERIIDAQSSACHRTLEIKFEPNFEYGDKASEYVEEYGVCPTSAPEYQNYIQQMRLELQPQPDCIGMEAGCSRYSTSHSTMHDEPHTFGMAAGCSRKRKYYNFMDLEDFQDLDSTEN